MIEKEHELVQRSPNPLEYLSDQSRKHFREIVEYLDMTETPTNRSQDVGHHEYYSDALFSIETNTTDPDAPNVSIWSLWIFRGVGVVTYSNAKQISVSTKNQISRTRGLCCVQLGFGPKNPQSDGPRTVKERHPRPSRFSQ